MRISPRLAGQRARRPALVFTVLLSSSIAAAADSSDHAHEHTHEVHGVTETIVVTGNPLEHDRDELAIPVDIVDRSDLLERLGSTLGETLTGVPGIATTGFAGGASRPVIRGQDAYRTEVLEDGLGTQDVSRESPDHAIPVNPLAAQRIEIIRGPAILRYGGGASAGVVNVITNRIPDQLPEEEISGEVFAGIGTVANERDLAATLDARLGSFALHGDGLLRRSNDYSIPADNGPRVQNGTDSDAFSGSLGTAYFHDESARIGFAYTRVESEYGIPEADESVEIDMRTGRFRFARGTSTHRSTASGRSAFVASIPTTSTTSSRTATSGRPIATRSSRVDSRRSTRRSWASWEPSACRARPGTSGRRAGPRNSSPRRTPQWARSTSMRSARSSTV